MEWVNFVSNQTEWTLSAMEQSELRQRLNRVNFVNDNRVNFVNNRTEWTSSMTKQNELHQQWIEWTLSMTKQKELHKQPNRVNFVSNWTEWTLNCHWQYRVNLVSNQTEWISSITKQSEFHQQLNRVNFVGNRTEWTSSVTEQSELCQYQKCEFRHRPKGLIRLHQKLNKKWTSSATKQGELHQQPNGINFQLALLTKASKSISATEPSQLLWSISPTKYNEAP